MSAEFYISVRQDGRNIRLKVSQIYSSDQLEKYEIAGRNRALTIQSNRPLIRSKGMKYRKPNYKLIAGVLHSAGLLERIIDEIHRELIYREKNG